MVVVYRISQGVLISAATFSRSNGRTADFHMFLSASRQTWRMARNVCRKWPELTDSDLGALFDSPGFRTGKREKSVKKPSRKAKGPGLRFLSHEGRGRLFRGQKFRAQPMRKNNGL